MNCAKCQERYNNVEHAPRILVACGHTLCEQCVASLLQNKKLLCPECQTCNEAESVSQFPKNLALLSTSLQMGTPVSAGHYCHTGNSSPESGISTSSPGSVSRDEAPQMFCSFHHKKIEAFCQEDKSLLCIDCLLHADQKYRQKEIVSIVKGSENHQNWLNLKSKETKIMEEQLRELQGRIYQTREELRDKTNSTKANISELFQEIKVAIKQREEELRVNCEAALQKEEGILLEKLTRIDEHLTAIREFSELSEQACKEKDNFKLLQASKHHYEIGTKASQKKTEINFKICLPELKKAQELDTISGIINPASYGRKPGYMRNTKSQMRAQSRDRSQRPAPDFKNNLPKKQTVNLMNGAGIHHHESREMLSPFHGKKLPPKKKRTNEKTVTNTSVLVSNSTPEKVNEKQHHTDKKKKGNVPEVGPKTVKHQGGGCSVDGSFIEAFQAAAQAAKCDVEDGRNLISDFDRAHGAQVSSTATAQSKLTSRRASARNHKMTANIKEAQKSQDSTHVSEGRSERGGIAVRMEHLLNMKRANFNEIRAKMKAERLKTPAFDLSKRQEFAESLKSEIATIKRAQRELEAQSHSKRHQTPGGSISVAASETKKKEHENSKADESEKDKQEEEIEVLSATQSSRNHDENMKKNLLLSSSSTIESYNSQKENFNQALLKPVRSQQNTSRRHVVTNSVKGPKNKYNSCGDESISHSASSHTLDIQSERATGAVCCRVDLSDRPPSRNERSEPRRLITSSSASQLGEGVQPQARMINRNMSKYLMQCDGIKSAIRTYNYLKPTISSQRKESGQPALTPPLVPTASTLPPLSSCTPPPPSQTPPLTGGCKLPQQQSSGIVQELFGDNSMSPQTPSYVRFSPSPADKSKPLRASIGREDDIVHNLFDTAAAPPSRQIQSALGTHNSPLSPPRESIIRMESIERIEIQSKGSQKIIVKKKSTPEREEIKVTVEKAVNAAEKAITEVTKRYQHNPFTFSDSSQFSSPDERASRLSMMSKNIRGFLETRQSGSITQSFIDMQNEHSKLDFTSLYKPLDYYIFVISGFLNTGKFNIQRFDLQKQIWHEVKSDEPGISQPRTKFAATRTYEKTLLLIGGKQIDGKRLATVDEFNPVTQKWINFPALALPRPRSGHAAVCLGRDIYVCGGNDGYSLLASARILDFEMKQWRTLPDMKYKRDEPGLTVGPDGCVYAIGGVGGSDNLCLKTAERYNPETGQWEEIAPMAEGRRSHATVTMPDGVYALGGFNGSKYLNSVEKYDYVQNKWYKVTPMNHARCSLSAVVSPDCQYIYAMGGFDSSPLNLVERYCVMSQTWEIVTPMKHKRFMHNSVILALPRY